MNNKFSVEALTRNFYKRRSISSRGLSLALDTMAVNVGWKSYRSQVGVFELLTGFKNIDWASINSVLDVGCGYGQLSDYLRSTKGFSGEYTGVDIISSRIKKANRLYGTDCRNHFINANFICYPWGKTQFDIVIESGAISVNYDFPKPFGDESLRYAEQVISMAVGLARYAVSIYFPSALNVGSAVISHDGDMAFYAPDQIKLMLNNSAEARLRKLDIFHSSESTSTKAVAMAYFNG